MKIFISYRRADSTYLIGRIKDRLMTAFGPGSVFRDLDNIPAGVDFRDVLEKETNDCNIMLVIIGPQWATIADSAGNRRLFEPSDYTRIEIETGLKRLFENKVSVIPVLVMNATMPSQQDLPESLGQLAYQNAISIRNDPDFNNDIDKLIRNIRQTRGYIEEDILNDYFEPKTIYIPEGSFWMGTHPKEGIPQYEAPQHEVFLPSYRIGKFPVTNIQYEEFISQTKTPVSPAMGWDGQRVPKGFEEYPVSGVTWFEALAYCKWLSDKTGRNYSLPNEAQWENACRAGKQSLFPWGDEFDVSRCNHGRPILSPVGSYPPQNEYGCFDLVGNVLQWTCTLWGKKRFPPDNQYLYPWKNDGRNNLNANRELRRVVRGSSMSQRIEDCRCCARMGQLPDDRGIATARHGFRVVLNIS